METSELGWIRGSSPALEDAYVITQSRSRAPSLNGSTTNEVSVSQRRNEPATDPGLGTVINYNARAHGLVRKQLLAKLRASICVGGTAARSDFCVRCCMLRMDINAACASVNHRVRAKEDCLTFNCNATRNRIFFVTTSSEEVHCSFQIQSQVQDPPSLV